MRIRTPYARDKDGNFIPDPSDPTKKLLVTDPRAAELGNVKEWTPPTPGDAPDDVPTPRKKAPKEPALDAVEQEYLKAGEKTVAGRMRIVKLKPMWAAMLGSQDVKASIAGALASAGIDPMTPVGCYETVPVLDTDGKTLKNITVVVTERPMVDAIVSANAELGALYGPTLVESAADAALYTNGLVLFAIGAQLFKTWRNSNVEVRDSNGNSV